MGGVQSQVKVGTVNERGAAAAPLPYLIRRLPPEEPPPGLDLGLKEARRAQASVRPYGDGDAPSFALAAAAAR